MLPSSAREAGIAELRSRGSVAARKTRCSPEYERHRLALCMLVANNSARAFRFVPIKAARFAVMLLI